MNDIVLHRHLSLSVNKTPVKSNISIHSLEVLFKEILL